MADTALDLAAIKLHAHETGTKRYTEFYKNVQRVLKVLIILLVIVPIVLWSWPIINEWLASSEKQENETTASANTAQPTISNPCGESEFFVVKPGEWTRRNGKQGCRWVIERDPNAGEKNFLARVRVRPNGMEKYEKIAGQDDIGEYKYVTYTFPVNFYLLMPSGSEPVYFKSSPVPEGS